MNIRWIAATVVTAVVCAGLAGGGVWWLTRHTGSSGTSATAAGALPDQPRYTSAQVQAAIASHTYEVMTQPKGPVVVRAINDPNYVPPPPPYVSVEHASCAPSALSYIGNGLWRCGAWSFDERTGLVFEGR